MTTRNPYARPADRRLFGDEQWSRIAAALELSPREAQIVQAVFDDHSEARIGRGLGISRHTVNTYLQRLYRKVDVASRTQLVVRVAATGFALFCDQP